MKIIVAGDYCPQGRVAPLIDSGDFNSVLGGVRALVSEADYSVVNFECPVCKGGELPLEKQGPNLCCSGKGVESIKWAGFDCVTLANNHFYDYGDDGVSSTLDVLGKYHLDHVGGGANLKEASSTLFKKVKGETLAVINCTEHEFSIATNVSGGANPLNPIAQYHAIKEAREKADHVLVIVHGGVEGYGMPTPRMVETYRFFVDLGADAVVNHHQHCYSGYETYKGKPIFYGLGNLCMEMPNSRIKKWEEGYAVGLTFDAGKVDFKIFPYVECKETPDIRFMEGEKLGLFEENLKQINQVIASPQALEEAYLKYLERVDELYHALFTPYAGRWMEALCEKRLLPTLFPKAKWPKMLNLIECESHREKLTHFIRNRLKKQ
jgi:poly-gamma-glutamate synthesis protein (capsule biosynthesis protein)